MNLEDSIREADKGNISAMIDVAGYYLDNSDLSLAELWAEKAAEAGAPVGNALARKIRFVLARAAHLLGRDFWDSEIEDLKAVIKWADIALQNAKPHSDYYKGAEEDKKEAMFKLAYVYYWEHKYSEAMTFCMGNDPYSNLIYGLCLVSTANEMFEQKQITQEKRNEWTKKGLSYLSVLDKNDQFFNSPEKEEDRLVIFTHAVTSYATFLRVFQEDLRRAYNLLTRAESVVEVEKWKKHITEERQKYKKRLFGGITYRET